MAPKYVRPTAPVPAAWPSGAAYAPEAASQAGMPWRDLIAHEKLRTVIERMLANNRDLRAAVANVAAARAQYRVQRAAQFPTIGGDASVTVAHGGNGAGSAAGVGRSGSYEIYSGSIGISGFEIDLFGRLRNQTKAQFEAYLASQSGARSTRLSLVSETATAYATLAADRDLLKVAQDTQASARRTVELTQTLLNAGLGSATDLENARTVLAQAESDLANSTTQVAQDRNALELLVGAPVEDALLPQSLAELDPAIGNVPAGLSSDVLLQRPDVVEAEHSLRGANASIGAARAAFFPQISLTSAVGLASTALSTLFKNDAFNWSVAPAASIPIIGGANRGNLQYAEAQRDLAVAQYEKAVQTAFRDVADGLARRGTIASQRAAQTRLVTAADRAFNLSERQFRAGISPFLDALTAQRTLYAARQSAVAVTLSDIANRITLYAAIGADDTL
jgi:outer membrane protein, multidrug efflux system